MRNEYDFSNGIKRRYQTPSKQQYSVNSVITFKSKSGLVHCGRIIKVNSDNSYQVIFSTVDDNSTIHHHTETITKNQIIDHKSI